MTTPLDLRGLPAPEPMERVLDALERLPEGQALRVLLPHEPYPLYRLLERDGWAHAAAWQAADACLVTIRRAPD
jgi:uncharacterized protein (DUF2249 family)